MSLIHPHVRTAQGQLTAAQVNAGKIIIDKKNGRTTTVVDGWLRAIGGAAGGTTSVDISDGTTAFVQFNVGGLGENAVLRAGTATNTVFTNLGTAAAAETAVKIIKNGSNLTGATHIDYCVHYKVTSRQA